MKEVTGSLWDYPADWRCITTNGVVGANGLVMGRGCAAQAAQRYPGLPAYAGARVTANGNVVQSVARHRLILFPVKHHWRDAASFCLIAQSAIRLAQLTEDHDLGTVVLPRPGCGAGQLDWSDVRDVIAPILPDSVHVITFK